MFGDGIYNLNPKATTPVSLLVESLVQQLCTLLEPNPTKSKNLYQTICEHLHQLKLIDETWSMNEFEMMRSQYQRALYQLVTISRGEGLPAELDSIWPLATPLGLEWSRYHREFDEIGFIASGGFGKVYKARNKLDGTLYAVKKITLKSTSVNNVLLHLAEVKTLASLNHQNIVPYKAAWLEPLLVPEQQTAKHSNEESSEEEDDSESESYSNDGQGSNEDFKRESSTGSDFIVFQSNTRSQTIETTTEVTESDDQGNNVLLKVDNRTISIAESQAHVKLKWATLFIQMTLCQLTLKEFLEKRNSFENIEEYYAKFIEENQKLHDLEQSTDDKRYSASFSSSKSFDLSDDFSERQTNPNHLQVVTNIFTQLVNGLSYIHSRKIVHHDLKPSNVFVSVQADGNITVALGDFGLACPLQEPHSGKIGTPLYCSPEQLEGECNFKSDIYSLGIILLELLIPLRTDMERAHTIRDVRKGIIPQNIPTNFKSLIKRLLDHRVSKRPDTSQLIELLTKIGSSKDQVISDLQRRLSERDTEIETLKQLVQEEKKTRDDNVRDKDAEIEQLKAKILAMEMKQCKE